MEVTGSNPVVRILIWVICPDVPIKSEIGIPTIHIWIRRELERHVDIVEVTGSIPVSPIYPVKMKIKDRVSKFFWPQLYLEEVLIVILLVIFYSAYQKKLQGFDFFTVFSEIFILAIFIIFLLTTGIFLLTGINRIFKGYKNKTLIRNIDYLLAVQFTGSFLITIICFIYLAKFFSLYNVDNLESKDYFMIAYGIFIVIRLISQFVILVVFILISYNARNIFDRELAHPQHIGKSHFPYTIATRLRKPLISFIIAGLTAVYFIYTAQNLDLQIALGQSLFICMFVFDVIKIVNEPLLINAKKEK